jgi:AraC-like DNA-binding protein
MEALAVPDIIQHQPLIKAGDITFMHYSDKGSLFKHRVLFNQYAVSFVLNGQKEIYRASGNSVIREGQAMLIPAGHSIIAEHSLNRDPYSSLIVFFPARQVTDFIARHRVPVVVDELAPFIQFNSTLYLREYVASLQKLISNRVLLSELVAIHKLKELLLVIYELFPAQLSALVHRGDEQLSLKSLVEHHLFKKLTLEELAFLANRSLSSFKRDFEKAYGISPQKYIRERKLEAACLELGKGKQASQLYSDFGYDNLSNFNTAFKRKFGLTPAAYRLGFSH